MNKHSTLWCCAVALLLMAAWRLSAGALAGAPATHAPGDAATSPTLNCTIPTQIPQPTQREEPPAAVLSFSPEMLKAVQMRYGCDLRPDLGSLLTAPTVPDLQGQQPTVLILHTHGTESFLGEYDRWVPFRTTDPDHNMLCIGREVARVLELGGVQVLHDTTLHDYPHYNTAYSSARKSIRAYLEEYPSIRVVLDLHRDASDDPEPMTTHATVGHQPSSQILFVVGTGSCPDWQDNLALALKLTVLLEEAAPGITRGISLRQQRFNMDLTPGSLLVEVGAAGDTREQALLAANALARAVLSLQYYVNR